jgi:hypothetical protein
MKHRTHIGGGEISEQQALRTTASSSSTAARDTSADKGYIAFLIVNTSAQLADSLSIHSLLSTKPTRPYSNRHVGLQPNIPIPACACEHVTSGIDEACVERVF